MTLPLQLPPPRDWQDFEDFCWELFSAEWGDPQATKYGRSGEAQLGVDIFGRRDGEWHAVQCKRRSRFPERSLSEREVRVEVEAAKGQSRKLASLVIATTAPPATDLSDLAAALSAQVGFRVEVYGWEELVRRLQRHEGLFQRWRARLGGTRLPHFAGVPPRNPYFHGREELLEQLAQRLLGEATTALTQSVTGLGGIGKTQAAIEYCHRHGGRYRHVIWANAQSPEALTTRYAELARQARLAAAMTPIDEAAAGFLAWLASERSWLLVLDNLEERPQDLPLPRGGDGHVLITTRLRSLPPVLGAKKPFEVDMLPVEEAAEFLLERVGRSQASGAERQAAGELARELDGLPLALEQAAAYIDDLQLSFGTYLDLLHRKRQVLALEDDSWGISGGYEKDVASTWLLNIEQLPAAAREIMDACAFLAPERIPLSLLVEHGHLLGTALSALAEELRSEPASAPRHLVRPLTRFSLFRFDPEREELSLHRMVQWIARQRLEALGEEARVLQQTHAMIEAAFPEEALSPCTWPACGLLFPHVVALQRSWVTPDEFTAFDSTRLWAAAGSFAWAAGRVHEALELHERIVEVRRQVLGEEHALTLKSLNNLAATRWALGDTDGACELHERVVTIRLQLLGEEHPDTLNSLNNLATTRRALGDTERARELHERVVQVRQRVLGVEHPDTLTSMNNLAETRWAMGDAKGAHEVHEQVVDVSRRVLGEQHPATLNSLNNLAATRMYLGDAEGARVLQEQIVDVSRRVLGEEHPATLTSLNNLGEILLGLNDAEGARDLHKRVVDASRLVLGEEHPTTLTSLSNLAAAYRSLGDAGGAREIQERVLEVRRRVLGDEHPDTLTSMNNLAETWKALGNTEEGCELLERVVEVRRRLLGEEHPDTLTSMNNLAAARWALGDIEGARDLYERVMEFRLGVLGEEHLDTLTSMNNLAAARWRLGDADEARELLERVVVAFQRVLGDEHPNTQTALRNLAAIRT